MRRIVIRIIRQLHGAMVVTALLSGICMVLAFFGRPAAEYFPYSLLVLIPYAASAWAEEHIRGIGVFLLICIASIIPPALFAPDIAARAAFIVLSVIIIVIRIGGRVRDAGTVLNSPHFATVILFAALYILGVLLENNFLMQLNYYLAFAYVLIILCYMNFTSLEGYLEVNKEVENIPIRTIGRTNNLMLLGYLGLTVAVMLLMPLLGLDRAIRAAWQGIMAFIRFLSSLRGAEEVAETVPPEPEAIGGEQMGPMDFGVQEEPPVWVEALYHALSVALAVAVGIMVVIGIVYAVYRIVKAFYRPPKDNDDVTEFISESDDRESAGGIGGILGRIREVFDNSPNMTVRKAYRKRVRQKKAELLASMTPKELEDAAGIPEGEGRSTLHELYEKARYSREGCSAEDVQKLKKAL